MTLDGKKEEQSCPHELCVSMAIKMKDDKSSLQALVFCFGIGIFTFNQIIATSVELSQFESAGYFKNRLELYD